jgi:hypothetical protein
MSIWICWYILRQEPEINLYGKQMLMTKPRVLTSMIWWDYVDLALSHSIVKISDEFLLKIKQDKFLNCHINYQSHMSISMHEPTTYACLWPIEFCQIVVTLGRIFSCFHDQDHVHPHIQVNYYTGSYAKHAIHPPKINTPKFQREFSFYNLAKGERGHWKKRVYTQEA